MAASVYIRRRKKVRVPRVRLHVREAEPAEDPLGVGLRKVAPGRALVQAAGGRQTRPDDRSVVPIQPYAGRRRVEGTAPVVRLRVGFPAVLARRIDDGQQRRSAVPGATATATAAAVVGRGRTVPARRRFHDLRPALRRNGNDRQQPRPLRTRAPVHLLRQSVLQEVRAQDPHQVR